jgi:tetratricopeptide (TPR) repeat protein
VAVSELRGRDREMSRITCDLASSSEAGGVLLLVGDPGIGKSALLEFARDYARGAGFTLLCAEGIEGEMHLPFGGLQQLVGPLMGSIGSLPVGHKAALETALGLASGPPPDLFLIAEAAYTLIADQAGRSRVAVVADDIQWLDPQSHQILAFLGHRARAGRYSVFGATRSGHYGPVVDAGFPILSIDGLDRKVALELLNDHASRLTAGILNDICDEAAGNPLALLELPKSWSASPKGGDQVSPLSARLESAFAGRVSDLSPETQDALLVAAVSSSNVTAEIVEGTIAFGRSNASPGVLKSATLAGLIDEVTDVVSFRHPLVRSGILQREPLQRRQNAHRALAEVLPADEYRGSWHRAWSITGPDDAIADRLCETVPDSLRRGAVMAAVSSLERSAQLTRSPELRGERLIQAAGNAFGVGRADVVTRILREAAAVDLSDLDRLRHILLTESLNGDVVSNPELVERLVRSAEAAAELGDKGLALDLLIGAALRIWWSRSSRQEQLRVLNALENLDSEIRDPRHTMATALTEPLLRSTEVHEILNNVDFDDLADADVLRLYGVTAYAIGDFVLAAELLDRAEREFRRLGRLGMLPVVLALQVHIKIDLGKWDEASAAIEDVTSVSLETGQAVFAKNNVIVEARAAALRGNVQLALELLATAENDLVSHPVNDRMCLAYQSRGAALVSSGRPDAAFACLRRQYDSTDPGYHLRESIGGIALMAEAALDSGQSEQGHRILDSFNSLFVVAPSPLLEINIAYASALLSEGNEKEEYFRSVLSERFSGWPWLQARARLEYGRWLAKSGSDTQAREQLSDSLAALTVLGAQHWVEKAATALEEIDSAP